MASGVRRGVSGARGWEIDKMQFLSIKSDKLKNVFLNPLKYVSMMSL